MCAHSLKMTELLWKRTGILIRQNKEKQGQRNGIRETYVNIVIELWCSHWNNSCNITNNVIANI